MSDASPNLESLFLAALELSTPAERDAFLERSCGGNRELKAELEQMLAAQATIGSFLERPPEEFAPTIIPGSAGSDGPASTDAGMATVAGRDADIVAPNAGRSVLSSLGQTVDVPCVVLRETADGGADPVTLPSSPEVPQQSAHGRYRLDGEIARGGMGAIIKGRDTDLGRDLAIKVLLDSHKNRPEVIQRFVEEAQIGGQLQHPGIAPVYELGQFADRRPFFTMKLVKGETLSKLLSDRRDTVDDRMRFLGIFEQICQTIAWSRRAHESDPQDANTLNTLDVALYRGSEWQEAIEVLQKSIQLGGETPHSMLFLAMSYWKLEERAQAREWYQKAITWREANSAVLQKDVELQAFFAEGEQLMGAELRRTSPAEQPTAQ